MTSAPLLASVAVLLFLAPAPAAQAEIGKLRDDDTTLFGEVVALHGDVAWATGVSKALAYRLEGDEWLQTLDFPVPFAGAVRDVATDGATAVVGVATAGGNPSGRAYVFEKSGDSWLHVTTLIGAGNTPFDRFGSSVAVNGATILVGAHGSDTFASLHGKVHVFERLAGAWTETSVFHPAGAQPVLQFGTALALQGERVLVGAIGDVGGVEAAGSAYVFERQAGVWTEIARLVGEQPQFADQAGRSVALDGYLAVVGATGRDVAVEDEGAAFVFELGGSGWVQTAEIFAPDGVPNETFGESVSTSADRILVGKPHDNHPPEGEQHTAYIFDRSGGPWVATKIFPADDVPFSNFGQSVALQDDLAFIGAPGDDDAAPEGGGAIYIVDVDAITVWTNLLQGLAGTHSVPQLDPQGLLFAGKTITATLSQALGSAPVFMIFGLGVAGVPFKGGTLVPVPTVVILGVTDAGGGFVVGGELPTTLLPPLSLVVQAWIVDAAGPKGFAASNALSGVVQ